MQPLGMEIEKKLGGPVVAIVPLQGGSAAKVYEVHVEGKAAFVVKVDQELENSACEGWMLTYLREGSALTVPDVIFCEDGMLALSKLPNDGGLSKQGECEAADQIAALHNISAQSYGLERDTVIAGLVQTNTWCDSWFDFYGQNRLLAMTKQAVTSGKLTTGFRHRIERIIQKLPDLAPPPKHPALLHGDLWGGNVLADQGCLSGFIDPAIYYGHPEMDLAFSTLFNSFSPLFYDRYQEHHAIEPGFFEERVDLYNLYPLLVHVRLFGAGYVADVDRVLRKFGC